MSSDRVLTTEVVVFLFEALLAGRLSREAACTLVSPWVEDSLPSESWARDGAQLLHGFDVVMRDGRFATHASVSGPGDFQQSDELVQRRCRAWLDSLT